MVAGIKSTKELTEEEIEDYNEAFNNFDKDGNGNIDEGELGVVMRSLGYSPTNQQLKDMMAKVSEAHMCHVGRVPRTPHFRLKLISSFPLGFRARCSA